jgi:hypothetical protein
MRAPGSGLLDSVSSMSGSYISATTGEVRGIPAAEPVLQVTFDLEAGGPSDGTSALFVINALLQGGGGPVILGSVAPVIGVRNASRHAATFGQG